MTASGLRAVCLVVNLRGRRRHRCGYVEVPPGHPLHGVGYRESTDVIPRSAIDSATLGTKSPMLLLTGAVDALDGEDVRRSPDIAFDAHGGLTYSGSGQEDYPVKSDGWWFGFDCSHYLDSPIDPDPLWPSDGVVRSEEYVVSECERLAQQITEMFSEVHHVSQ